MMFFLFCIGAAAASMSEDIEFVFDHPIYILCVVVIAVLCLGCVKITWIAIRKCYGRKRVVEDKEKKIKVVYYPLLMEENTERGNKNYSFKNCENLKNLRITPIAKESHFQDSSVFSFPSIPFHPNNSFSAYDDRVPVPCQNSLNINGNDKTLTNNSSIPRYHTPKIVSRPRANSNSSVPVIPYVYLNK